MCKVLKKFTEGNARKSTVNFAFSGYADVIKYQEKPTFSYECAQITEARIISARAVIKLQGATLTSPSEFQHLSWNILAVPDLSFLRPFPSQQCPLE